MSDKYIVPDFTDKNTVANILGLGEFVKIGVKEGE